LKIQDLIYSIADNAIDAQSNRSGYMPPGNNGPYNDPEIPVRNTGHWLITFSNLFKWTKEDKFLDAVSRCAGYLMSAQARPYGHSYHHRNDPQKDKCNGLIGQAWTIEALAEAALLLDDSIYSQRAEEVFFQHNFNEEYGLWNRQEIDGQILSIDKTFNHQLWFAACASLLKSSMRKEIERRVIRFLDCLLENITILDNGLIYHPIERQVRDRHSKVTYKHHLKNLIDSSMNVFGRRRTNQDAPENNLRYNNLVEKSVGYHHFNLYALALVKQQLRDHPFWESTELKKMVNYLFSNEFQLSINNNSYGYPYNPPGFEIPFVMEILCGINPKSIKQFEFYINEQFKRNFNPATNLFERNNGDVNTCTARLYELTRLSPDLLNKIHIKLHND